ncbi:MAG: regulatory protein RecX [Eubacterium sp.]|nr:recombination regulator RecX [Eubacterium sp.]MDY4110442.1 regulatory protein RecX [Eubacterium sp.]
MILTHQKGRGTKVHLFLDGEYAATTDENCWLDNYISNGTDIDDEQWQALLVKINYKKALNKCADYLSRRDYSVKELKTKLLKSVDEVSAQKAVDRYIEAGYLNDEKYCQMLIEYLLRVKRFSLSNIKQECFKRGIDREIVEDKLSDFEIDNVSTVIELIKTKYASKLNQENGKEKVIAALQRKGFYYSDIKSAFYRIEEYDE